ncbi:replication initiation protein [Pelagimonas varians]|uniref:Initiator Replication protein n=1 Tax=Pelagimonas varians TaxID=696760 RepID=A0A238L675_9RHOB|nr:replication initiation protein [Pelagimonas varians]PYG25031.1 replication initiator protein [Pelagimonas varians]SMX50613.1 Initiator Replication protein [Pelagimonas varians]
MAKMTTIDAVRMHRPDPDAIVAAVEISDMRFASGDALSLRAAKLFCLLIQDAGISVAEPAQHKIPYSALNETFHASREELAAAAMELHSTIVSVQLVSRHGRPCVKSGPILSDFEREPDSLDDAEIRFEFSPAMRQVIADSTHWAAVSRRAVLAFESKYSLRLYLHIGLRVNHHQTSEELSIDELRGILGISPNTLPRWQDVKRRALEIAIAEINQLAGFTAAYTPLKRGRRIVGVRLAWGQKATPDLIETQRELDRPRVGRTARRDGLVETIAQQRHRLAESLANAPCLDRTGLDPIDRHDTPPVQPDSRNEP